MNTPETQKRLFFALWPDARQRERLRDWAAPMVKDVEGKVVFRGNWHVTLAFLGDTASTLVPTLQQRAAEIPFEPFRLRFDRIEYWARPKIACLVPSVVPPELEQLVTRLNSVLTDVGLTPEDRTYRPHMTFVKGTRPFEKQRLAQPLTFEWTGFELLESISERGDVRYIPLKQ